jgi:hypothetical protein
MTITPIGLVIIPLSLAIFLVWPRLLVPWAIVASVFQAASVINIGAGESAIGLAPFFFVVILIALRFVPQYLTARFGFVQGDPLLNLFRPLMLFAFWGAASAFVLPFLFANVVVNTPHGGMDAVALPLHWSLSNAAQAGYLLLDCIFILYVTWLARDHSEMEADVRAFRCAGIIAVAVAVYQLVAHKLGLPYPQTFFNSNEAWSQLITQKIAGTWRLSATFTEPSAAGGFFSAWSSFLLFSVADRTTARKSDWLLLCAGMAMLLLTTSSTGYVVVGIMLSAFMMQQMLRLVVQGTMNPRVAIVCLVIGVGAIGAMAFLPDFGHLLQVVLFEKTGTTSAKDRTATQWQSLLITSESFGLGVGLGSNRPSGILFYILSNLGFPGLLLFIYCLYVTFSLIRNSVQPRMRCPTARGYLRGSAWAFGVSLLTMVISGADVTTPQLWITWSLMAAVMGHAYASMQRQAVIPAFDSCFERPFGLVYTARSG